MRADCAGADTFNEFSRDYSRLGYQDLNTEWETRILKIKIDPLRPSSSIQGEMEKIDLTMKEKYHPCFVDEARRGYGDQGRHQETERRKLTAW
jgi:hypothetical protein